MTRTKSTILALVVVVLSPMAANADLIRLDATNLESSIFDFWIDFYDTGDGLLQMEEVVDFSGYYIDTFVVGGVPDISGFATIGYDSAYPVCKYATTYWCFPFPLDVYANSARTPDADLFSYRLTSVPEPGTLALFGIGLLGMGLARRRKQV